MMTDVIFTILSGASGDIGKITLNRPQALNALTLPMCVAIHQQLRQWAHLQSIKAVIITGAGERAFCAGGDVRAVYELCVKAQRYEEAMNFFREEYAMNQAIFNFPKPYIAFLDGVTMGGGVGVSIHGSHALASERLTWAMPETRIGFFPDVGVGYHLAKLRGHAGDYLALTGERVLAGDVYQLGLVKAVIPSERWIELESALVKTPFNSTDFNAVTEIIMRFHQQPAENLNVLGQHYRQINQYFSGSSVEAMIAELAQSGDSWCQATGNTLSVQSPLSVKITHEHLRHCRHFDFQQVMAENAVLAQHFIHDHDFFEGVRAAVIDKDRRPRWRPGTLAEVAPAIVRQYFLPG